MRTLSQTAFLLAAGMATDFESDTVEHEPEFRCKVCGKGTDYRSRLCSKECFLIFKEQTKNRR